MGHSGCQQGGSSAAPPWFASMQLLCSGLGVCCCDREQHLCVISLAVCLVCLHSLLCYVQAPSNCAAWTNKPTYFLQVRYRLVHPRCVRAASSGSDDGGGRGIRQG